MVKVLVVQPDELSPAGLIGESLDRNEIETVTIALDNGGSIPRDLENFDGALLLGGPQSVVEEKDRELVGACVEVVRRFHDSGRPLLGICLGAQIIAHGLGAEVRRLDRLHFGIHDLTRLPAAEDDAVVTGMQAVQPAFLWHEDGFDLPEGARHLVSGSGHSGYGFAVGPLTYGFQCHLEVTREGIGRMVERGSDFVIKHLGAEGEALLADLDAQTEARLSEAMQFGQGVGDAWAALVHRTARQGADRWGQENLDR